jgi:serine/threonine-protein kinase RsbW
LEKATSYNKTVRAATENLSDIRKFVARNLADQGFSADAVADITLAVDEACTNIIKHAYKNDASQLVDIDLEFDDHQICVCLKDQGESFKEHEYSLPDIREQIKKKKRGGMGVYLIHKLMDRVNYNTSGEQNEIRMYKKRN